MNPAILALMPITIMGVLVSIFSFWSIHREREADRKKDREAARKS